MAPHDAQHSSSPQKTRSDCSRSTNQLGPVRLPSWLARDRDSLGAFILAMPPAMKPPTRLLSRNPAPMSSPGSLSALLKTTTVSLNPPLRRGLSPNQLVFAIAVPVILFGLVLTSALVWFLRRRRKRRERQNSRTTAVMGTSLDEDLASYREERQRSGDFWGTDGVMMQEDLAHQLMGRDYRTSRTSYSSSTMGEKSRQSSRHSAYRRSDNAIRAWHSPPPPLMLPPSRFSYERPNSPLSSPKSGPVSRATSRTRGTLPGSGLSKSIKSGDAAVYKEFRGQ